MLIRTFQIRKFIPFEIYSFNLNLKAFTFTYSLYSYIINLELKIPKVS